MIKYVSMVVLSLAIMLPMTGCEWSSGGDDSSWSGTPDWVNFSGVYRGSSGGVLVTDYTATPGTTGTVQTVTGEGLGTTDGTSSMYQGILNNKPLVEGSLSINSSQFNLSDNGGGALSGGGAVGSIDYGTGAWSVDIGAAPDAGDPITASYQYTIAGTQGSGSAGPGTSGIVIYTFTVFQQGNTLNITDNNGSVYKGKFGDVSMTNGGTGGQLDEDGNEVFEVGATAIAQYSVEGVSAAGLNVRMVGTMQGVLATASGSFADRRMYGTWIEDGGRTGDINGESSPIAGSTNVTTTATN